MQLDMTKGKPLPVILQFTIPLVIGNIFQQLYNMADTIIVGRYVGAGALAAVGSTGTIMFLATGFAQGITAGFSILTAQRYGAGDEKGVKRSVANGMILAVIAAVILTLVCVAIMNPLLHLMNTPSDIFQDAYTYIMGISVGLTANILQPVFLLSAGGGKQSDPTLFPDIFRLPERGSGSAFYHPRRHGCGRSSLGDESVPGDLGGALRGIYLG